MRLADFILANVEPILAEWEVFARAIWPGSAETSPAVLRDDAEDMLRATVADMRSDQTAVQRSDKARGKRADSSHNTGMDRASFTHGAGRHGSGFDLPAVIAEYRALRASVIQLWHASNAVEGVSDLDDLTRFNESIDQSLTEAVMAFTKLVEQARRLALDAQSGHARELRDLNEALMVSSVRQHELAEQAEHSREAIAATERELSDFFDNASIGMHWVGPDGIVLRVNQAELDMLGYGGPGGREQYVGRHIAEFHADGPVIDDILLRLASGETLRDHPARLCCKDGSIRHVLINSSVLFTNGEFVHTRCFTTDVTERTLADEQLRAAKRQAEEANRAKDKFLAVLSHELRTPLTPVLMAATSLEDRDGLPPDVREDVAMIRRNVELQSRLIDDLLDLSRIISGKLRLAFDVLATNELVRQACDNARGAIRERGVQLHCDLDADVLDVVGDGGRLQQVFWNLLNNAAKFTPEGGQVFVHTANADDERVRVTVRDTGIGIVPEAMARIFDAFEQVEDGDPGVSRQYGGLGLGLAICRALVEQHRGSILAYSDGPGRGSTSIVELPALARPAARARPDGRSPAAPARLTALRLLLVEDQADTASVLSRLLTRSGHAVKIATTAAAALRLAREHEFDIIVSDLGLPDMTGHELMRQIKGDHGAAEVATAGVVMGGIALSGYGMEEDIRKSVEAGFSDHLVKPVSMSQLEESIRRLAAASANGKPASTPG